MPAFNFVAAQVPSAGNIVINEILSNPPSGGFDYVEGFNKSDSTIDLQELVVANRNSTAEVASRKPIALEPLFLPPGAFFLATANAKWVRQHYHVPDDAIICEISSLPSLPDDAGTVIFLTKKDSVVDEVSYSEKWHFALLSNSSGVALERLSYFSPSQDKNNWTSASSASGYGTPGYRNSQFLKRSPPNDEIAVPTLFSPDNDGINDLELLQFNLKEPGYVINTMVYDLSGRKVRHLIKNESPGLTAIYKWDGLDDKSAPLPQGIYIIATDMFTLAGKTRRIRNAVMLARK